MQIKIVGIGMGNPDLLTVRASRLIQESGLLIGARRMLDCFGETGAEKVAAATPEQIAMELSRRREREEAVVLVSGDVGFYSASRRLMRLLETEQVELVPGISSLQYFCARVGCAWDDAAVVSLHGREQNLIRTVRTNKKTFVLTGGQSDAAKICGRLCESGLGDLRVQVGERLSYPEEKISQGTAQALCRERFDPLSVLLIYNRTSGAADLPATHGLPDEAFLRGEVPMTKAEVRAVSIAKLALERGQTVWDVGAGTGSVAVEIARVLSDGLVFAVEKEPDACALIERNRLRFGLQNLRLIYGTAPDALEHLPAPDAVFIGGNSGGLAASTAQAVQKNPRVRIVVNAITLETVGDALETFRRLKLAQPEIVQVSVSKARPAGTKHLLFGQNPVFILSAGGKQAWNP